MSSALPHPDLTNTELTKPELPKAGRPNAEHPTAEEQTPDLAESGQEDTGRPDTGHPDTRHTASVAVLARGTVLTGPRGQVFGPLELTLPESRLGLLVGDHGSGRTCALLCLTGRMKPSGGSLEVFGNSLPKARSRVQRISAIACSTGLDDIDESLTVRELFLERLQMVSSPRRRGKVDPERIEELCAPAFGDGRAPGPKTLVWDIDLPGQMALQIALALVGRPRLLAVDDLDQLPVPDRVDLFATLQGIADRGTTVVATTSADVLPAAGGAKGPVVLAALQPGQRGQTEADAYSDDAEHPAADAYQDADEYPEDDAPVPRHAAEATTTFDRKDA